MVLFDHRDGLLVAGCSYSMRDACLRKIDHAPTGNVRPLAPVDIFAIHKKPLVQQAYLLERLAPDHQRRTGEPAHVADPVVFPVGHQISADKPVVGEKLAQGSVPEYARKHGRNLRAENCRLPSGFRTFGPSMPTLGFSSTKSMILRRPRVSRRRQSGLTRNTYRPPDLAYGLIVRRPEAAILKVFDQFHATGVITFDSLCAAVGGGVVDHDDFEVDISWASMIPNTVGVRL